MKIQLDTKAKTIKIEEDVKLKDFIAILDKLLPKKEWLKFTLETHTVINNWSNPIIIRDDSWYRRPWWSGSSNDYEVSNNTNGLKMQAGVYNVEV